MEICQKLLQIFKLHHRRKCETSCYLCRASRYTKRGSAQMVLVGVNGELLPTAEKIKNGYRFKEHVMRALEIRPDDADLHHLLGRFRYEVANLSWIERKVAATLFSEPPSASYEDAIDSFQKTEDFSVKVNLENRLFLSKCYIALSKYDSACQLLEKICDLSVTNKDDKRIQSDARQLLAKYSGYRQ